ncbi:UNVERIFIED_CONTAM: hypothetical protein FKN15_004925 [Acipenser sinensis]
MASDGRPDCSCCSHGSAAPHSVQQTLDEMDFERGIWSAAVDGDLDRVRTFLLKGTDPNTVDRAGYTALHYASRAGCLAVCELLLEHGASANSQTRGGATPLHRAAYRGHLGVVRLLLSQGAEPGTCDDDGSTPLHKYSVYILLMQSIAVAYQQQADSVLLYQDRCTVQYLLQMHCGMSNQWASTSPTTKPIVLLHPGTRERMSESYRPLEDKDQLCSCPPDLTRCLTSRVRCSAGSRSAPQSPPQFSTPATEDGLDRANTPGVLSLSCDPRSAHNNAIQNPSQIYPPPSACNNTEFA